MPKFMLKQLLSILYIAFFPFFVYSQSGSGPRNWQRYTDSILGFEVEVPATLTLDSLISERIQKTPGFNAKVFTVQDFLPEFYYLLSVSSADNDMYINNDSLFLESIRENQKITLSSVSLDTVLYRKGQLTYLLEGESSRGENLAISSMVTIRMNRFYSIVVVADKSKIKGRAAQRFLQSFKLRNQSPTTFQQYEFADSRFSTMLPEPFKVHVDSTFLEYPLMVYSSRDTITSQVYNATIVALTDKL